MLILFLFFRREILRVLGLLGTLDPYKHKMNMRYVNSQIKSTVPIPLPDFCSQLETEWKIGEILFKNDTLDEYYPPVVISTLIRIIRNPNLTQHHHIVVQASEIKFIIKNKIIINYYLAYCLCNVVIFYNSFRL